MGLSVYLTGHVHEVECCCECGHCHKKRTADTLYKASITHNLNHMAHESGIYKPIWRPDEIGITKAAELIGPLIDGIKLLESDKRRFSAFNPINGFGRYEDLIEFAREYMEACQQNPDATVTAWR